MYFQLSIQYCCLIRNPTYHLQYPCIPPVDRVPQVEQHCSTVSCLTLSPLPTPLPLPLPPPNPSPPPPTSSLFGKPFDGAKRMDHGGSQPQPPPQHPHQSSQGPFPQYAQYAQYAQYPVNITFITFSLFLLLFYNNNYTFAILYVLLFLLFCCHFSAISGTRVSLGLVLWISSMD